jgi:hypothetical protein
MMTEKIKIGPDLRFDYTDLFSVVDFDHEFTLRDVIESAVSSKIPMEMLCRILRCPYLVEYHKEVESKPFEDGGDIEYLELYWLGDKDQEEDGSLKMSSQWCFHGVGREGVVCDDVIACYEMRGEKVPEDYRERYSLTFSPMYKLADYKIKVCDRMYITNWAAKRMKSEEIPFVPSLMLVEVLFWIFWELSFLGGTKERDASCDEIAKRCNDFDKGVLETKTSEEVFADIKKKFGEKKES